MLEGQAQGLCLLYAGLLAGFRSRLPLTQAATQASRHCTLAGRKAALMSWCPTLYTCFIQPCGAPTSIAIVAAAPPAATKAPTGRSHGSTLTLSLV